MKFRFPIRSVEQIDRKIRLGRGQGSGSKYAPWIMIHELSSLGRSHKVPGVKIDRTHHFLSDLEFRFFLIVEFNNQVIDIREQFPLLPYQRTVEIAKDCGIKHPVYPGTKIPTILTTDFLLSWIDRKAAPNLLAISIKYANALSSARTLEKLELERKYWAERGVNWALVTERNIPPIIVRNLNWLRSGAHIPEKLELPALQNGFLDKFVEFASADIALKELLKKIRLQVGINEPEAVNLFKFMGWHQKLKLDITRPINLHTSAPLIDKSTFMGLQPIKT